MPVTNVKTVSRYGDQSADLIDLSPLPRLLLHESGINSRHDLVEVLAARLQYAAEDN